MSLKIAALRNRWVVAASLVFGAGCERAWEMPSGYQEIEKTFPANSGARVLEEADAESLAIRLTRDAPAPDGKGSNEDWVQRKIEALGKDVLFPRWEARRRAAGKFEVTFTYTLVSGGESVERRCFAWTADVVLHLVSPPRELSRDELSSRGLRMYRPRQRQQPRIELMEE